MGVAPILAASANGSPLISATPRVSPVGVAFSVEPNVLKNDCVLGAVIARNCDVGTNANRVVLLRTRVHSVEEKKNILCLILGRIGPPTEYPNWLRVNPGLGVSGSPCCRFTKFCALIS